MENPDATGEPSGAPVHRVPPHGSLRIEPDPARPVLATVRHDDGSSDLVLLPADAFRGFLVTAGDVGLSISGDRLRAGPADAADGGEDHGGAFAPFAAPLRHGASIRSMAALRNRKAQNAVKNLRMMDLGSEALLTAEQSRAMFDAAVPHLSASAPSGAIPLRAGVLVHLFYHDLWAEFAAFIRAAGLGERVFVSLTDGSGGIRERILGDFPGAIVQVVPNRGRDVAPFLRMYADGVFGDCEVLCKLHSKKSAAAQGEYLGRLWRRRNLFDLIGSAAQARAIIGRFADCPGIGMIGAPTLRLPNARFADREHETHLPGRRALLRRMGRPDEPADHDFFAGTMFWVRLAALDGLERLAEGPDLFTDERLQLGENVEHAIERGFADLVRANGFRVADAVPCPPATMPGGLRRSARPGEPRPAPNALLLGRSEDFAGRWTQTLPADLAGRHVALFATYSETGAILPYTARYLAFLRDSGHVVIPLVATPDPATIDDAGYLAFSPHVFLRENGGFDFSMWASALATAPQLWSAESLLFCNDSVIGPGNGDTLLARLSASGADAVALTESAEGGPHLQSYFFRLNRRALGAAEVRDFFATILAWSDKTEVTRRYERGLSRVLAEAGLRHETLFPLGPDTGALNPTLHFWRRLLDQGYPFLKAEVLRDARSLSAQLTTRAGDPPPALETEATAAILAQHGFDVEAVRTHIAAMRAERARNAFLDPRPAATGPDLRTWRRRVMRFLRIPTKKERAVARLRRQSHGEGAD